MKSDFCVIGAGLAGSEAALVLANQGAHVTLVEQKPQKFSAAHKLNGAAELVCSNSLKSTEITAGHGLLKSELELLKSPLLQLAYQERIPAGNSLTVDREKFSEAVTRALKNHPSIQMIHESLEDLPRELPTLIATGPLTNEGLMKKLLQLCDDKGLYFYDATSPIVSLESLDMNYFFWGSRQGNDDYLNLPLDRETYSQFRKDLMEAEKVGSHLAEENLKFFEGCLPIEELARRGELTMAYSCLKPIGLSSPQMEHPFAVIQFRREKAAGHLLNMVGFQTQMKWPEQERVFRTLPGMKEAVFVRLGAMHRNSFINSPLHLDFSLKLKKDPLYSFAGQITGSEGYTEAIATGHYAALQMMNFPKLPETSAIQSLVRYLIESDPRYFQPMNFNFGLLPPFSPQTKFQSTIKESLKKRRHRALAERALRDVTLWLQKNSSIMSTNFKSQMSSPTSSVLTPNELVKSISNDL